MDHARQTWLLLSGGRNRYLLRLHCLESSGDAAKPVRRPLKTIRQELGVKEHDHQQCAAHAVEELPITLGFAFLHRLHRWTERSCELPPYAEQSSDVAEPLRQHFETISDHVGVDDKDDDYHSRQR